MNQKMKVQIETRLKLIAKGTFDQNTIALLLIDLREYVPQDSITKDVSHFVAHHDRDRGIFCESITYLFCQVQVFRKAQSEDNEICIDSLPFDCFQALKGYCKRNKHLSDWNRFEKAYKYNKQSKNYDLKGALPDKIESLLIKATSVIDSRPIATKESLIQDLIKGMEFIGFKSSANEVAKNGDAITLGILSILHLVKFNICDGVEGFAFVKLDKNFETGRSKIYLSGNFPLLPGNGRAIYPIIATDLDSEQWLSERIKQDISVDSSYTFEGKYLCLKGTDEKKYLDYLD